MKTIAAFAFFFYLLWAPVFTIGTVVYCLRKLDARYTSIPWYLLAVALLAFVAGPVAIDGPLPGFMPWWAVGFIAYDQHSQSFVVYYVLLVSAVFAVRIIRDANAKKTGGR